MSIKTALCDAVHDGGAHYEDTGGPWVTVTLTNGQEITGILGWDARHDLLTVLRQTGGGEMEAMFRVNASYVDPTFAETPIIIDPARVVSFHFAEAGA